MITIVLNDTQAQLLTDSPDDVQINDPHGNVVGVLKRRGFSDDEIEQARLRSQSSGPWRTTQEVLERLRSHS